MSRLQRRANEKQNKKELSKIKITAQSTPDASPPTEDRTDQIVSDLTKVFNYSKNLDQKFTLLVETLSRLGICSWKDLVDTENLFRQKEVVKQLRIKELLKESHTPREYLSLIKEDPSLPGYQKLNIDPVKDLNLNPYEIAQIIRDDYPDKTIEEHLSLGQHLFKLTKAHFGIA